MEITVKRTFGQDMTVFQTAAMRARSALTTTTPVASDDQQQQQQHIGVNDVTTHGGLMHQSGRHARQRRVQTTDHVDQATIDLRAWLELPDSAMMDPDDKGLCRIHRAAERGFIPIFEKAAVHNKQLMELKTSDGSGMTPLLVAVQAGNLESVRGLTELGVKLEALDAKGQGVVELCAARRDCRILDYYARLEHDKLPVWKRLIKLVKSDFDEEAEPASWCLYTLTKEFDGHDADSLAAAVDNTGPELLEADQSDVKSTTLSWSSILEASVVHGLVHVLKVSSNELVKRLAFQTLFNLIGNMEVRDQAVYSGIVPVLAKLLTDNSPIDVVLMSASLIANLADVRQFPEEAQRHAVYAALITATSSVVDRKGDTETDVDPGMSFETVTQIVETMGRMVRSQSSIQTAFGATPGAFETLVSLYDITDVSERFMTSLSESVSRLAIGHHSNQCQFVDAGILDRLVSLANNRADHETQLAAVNAFRDLVDGNKQTQKAVLGGGLVESLWKVVKRSAEPAMRCSAAGCLWTVAEADIEERRRLAELMSATTFVDFITSVCGPVGAVSDNNESNELLVIGAQGIQVLWSGVQECQSDPSSEFSTLKLLLNAGHAHCVIIAALRALRKICIGVGYVPRPANQNAAFRTLVLRSVATLAHTPRDASVDNDIVRMEALLTLAIVQLGNREMRDEISQLVRGDDPFSINQLIEMMNKSPDARVQLLAGEALAAFAYNSVSNQATIRAASTRLMLSGTTLNTEVYRRCLLTADDECSRCNAAFQVVVLSPLLVGESAASIAATGIKLLVDCLASTSSDTTRVLVADCIGRLGHTRAGIPEALVAVSAVELLCDLLTSRVQLVCATAAVAIGYLTFNCNGRRRLLNRCRLYPVLMDTVVHFCSLEGKLPLELAEEWKHYEKIGLPSTENVETRSRSAASHCGVNRNRTRYGNTNRH